MKIEIEKNIPLPTFTGRNGTKWNFLGEMSVGDSVLIPDGFIPVLQQWRSNVRPDTRFPGRTFISRSVEGGVRIWLISDDSKKV